MTVVSDVSEVSTGVEWGCVKRTAGGASDSSEAGRTGTGATAGAAAGAPGAPGATGAPGAPGVTNALGAPVDGGAPGVPADAGDETERSAGGGDMTGRVPGMPDWSTWGMALPYSPHGP